jgi:hypothetical protein
MLWTYPRPVVVQPFVRSYTLQDRVLSRFSSIIIQLLVFHLNVGFSSAHKSLGRQQTPG